MKLSKFLGVDLNEEQIDKIVQYTSFHEMKKRDDHVINKGDAEIIMDLQFAKAEGGFFRSGSSGGWRNILSQEQKEKFEMWIANNCPDEEILGNFIDTDN
ncbi:amine sulfotransferase [Hyalella azteca]|uniref:Amine sulfotransferase n=1 Tax=Hyalella azteca TaxID=294128 RepID=A0A8B7P139_HYAAZ|nr:amine sulfotransferase [Hyalella azteca]